MKLCLPMEYKGKRNFCVKHILMIMNFGYALVIWKFDEFKFKIKINFFIKRNISSNLLTNMPLVVYKKKLSKGITTKNSHKQISSILYAAEKLLIRIDRPRK